MHRGTALLIAAVLTVSGPAVLPALPGSVAHADTPATCSGLTDPLWEAAKPTTSLFTTSQTEYTSAVSTYGFTDGKGTVARVSKTSQSGLSPVYRMYHPSSSVFRWVTEANLAAAQSAGFQVQRVDFYAFAAPSSGCETVRTYTKGSSVRTAVTSAEQVSLITEGWSFSGDSFFAPRSVADAGLVAGKVVIGGDVTASTANQTFSNLDVRGSVLIRATGVRLQDSTVRGGTNAAAGRYWPLVDARQSFAGTVIKNTLIQESVPSEWNASGIGGSNFVADGVTVIGQVDSINVTGSNVTIQNSVLKDNVRYENHRQSQPSGPTHNDNIQVLKGDNITIRNNVLTGSQSLGIIAAPEWGTMKNLVINHNFVDDGECSIKVSDKGGNEYGITVTDNVLGGHQRSWKCHIVTGGGVTAHLTISGNVLGNGTTPTAATAAAISAQATGTPANVIAGAV